jgi:hypothetical protein
MYGSSADMALPTPKSSSAMSLSLSLSLLAELESLSESSYDFNGRNRGKIRAWRMLLDFSLVVSGLKLKA